MSCMYRAWYYVLFGDAAQHTTVYYVPVQHYKGITCIPTIKSKIGNFVFTCDVCNTSTNELNDCVVIAVNGVHDLSNLPCCLEPAFNRSTDNPGNPGYQWAKLIIPLLIYDKRLDTQTSLMSLN